MDDLLCPGRNHPNSGKAMNSGKANSCCLNFGKGYNCYPNSGRPMKVSWEHNSKNCCYYKSVCNYFEDDYKFLHYLNRYRPDGYTCCS